MSEEKLILDMTGLQSKLNLKKASLNNIVEEQIRILNFFQLIGVP
jgi:hypothetical protein